MHEFQTTDLLSKGPVGPERGLKVQLGVVVVEIFPIHDHYVVSTRGFHVGSGRDGW